MRGYKLKEAFHANETKVVALLSSNLVFFLESHLHCAYSGCPVKAQSLGKPRLTSAHKAQALLCCLDEDDSGRRYEELLRLIEEKSEEDSTFATVATDVRTTLASGLASTSPPRDGSAPVPLHWHRAGLSDVPSSCSDGSSSKQPFSPAPPTSSSPAPPTSSSPAPPTSSSSAPLTSSSAPPTSSSAPPTSSSPAPSPHLVGFVLCWEQCRVRAVLAGQWLQAASVLAETGLMTAPLRRRLLLSGGGDCSSTDRAAMILDHLARTPAGPPALLKVLQRLSLYDSAAACLLHSLTARLAGLLEGGAAALLDHRIRRVLFPAASCWPGRIAPCEPLDQPSHQQLYCHAWQLSRSGCVSQAIAMATSSSRHLHCDVQVALAEVVLTGTTHHSRLYRHLEELLAKCQHHSCWNSDLLSARIHKRLVVYYFYTAQDMGRAYHHLYRGYELSTRIQPDEGTVRIIASWAEYMHIVGDYGESRRCFALAVEHAQRVPEWMRPMVEAVKIDKAHFHVHRGNLLASEQGGCSVESDREVRDAQNTLETLDLTILPPSHLSFAHYVLARIALYRKDILAAKQYVRRAIKLEPSDSSPNYRRVAGLQTILAMM